MQFSLKSLFLATAVVAALFGVACALPDGLSLTAMTFITLILPGATFSLAIYGRGYPQAFAIGCIVSPVGSAFFAIPIFAYVILESQVSSSSSDVLDSLLKSLTAPNLELTATRKLEIISFHLMNITCGLMAVAVRWWIQSSKSRENNRRMKLLGDYARDQALASATTYAVFHARVRPQEHDSASVGGSHQALLPQKPLSLEKGGV